MGRPKGKGREALDSIFARVYPRSASQKEEQKRNSTDSKENDATKKRKKHEQANSREGGAQGKREYDHTGDRENSEQEYVCLVHRVKERFYTSNGKLAHVSEERPMMVALMRFNPVSNDAECNITVDAEDAN